MSWWTKWKRRRDERRSYPSLFIHTERPLRSAGWGTRVLACILMGFVGAIAGLAAFFYLAQNGLPGETLNIAGRPQPIDKLICYTLVGWGMISGVLYAIIEWPDFSSRRKRTIPFKKNAD